MLNSLLRNWTADHDSFRESMALMLWDLTAKEKRRGRRQWLRERFLTLAFQNNFAIGSLSFSAQTSISGDVAVECGPVSVPVAQGGTVTTHTSNSDVVLTMSSSSHGITNTARCDLYWTGGVRRGMIASNVSGTSVELTGGTGDNAPAGTTAIKVGKCVTREFSFTNANLVLIACQCNWESIFAFVESDGTTEDWFQHVVPATNGQPAIGAWYSAYGANPTTGTAIAKVYLSHADTAAAHNMQAGAVLSV